jgi:hypothetical protein
MLGASRAAIFPVMTPALSTVFSWTFLGAVPQPGDAPGLAMAMAGLIGLCRVVDPKTEFSRKGTGVPQTGRTCAASA